MRQQLYVGVRTDACEKRTALMRARCPHHLSVASGRLVVGRAQPALTDLSGSTSMVMGRLYHLSAM